jgi:hypothetical protein
MWQKIRKHLPRTVRGRCFLIFLIKKNKNKKHILSFYFGELECFIFWQICLIGFFFLKHFSGSCFWNFMFSPNFVVDDGKINLIFSNEKMHKVQMPKLQMSILVIHHHQLLISQFLKILLKKFSNEKMHKVQMPKLQMHKLQMSMFMIHTSSPTSDISISKNSSKRLWNLILTHWNMIIDCVVRYENMMLIAEIKFEELTLKLVCTDLCTVSDYHGPPHQIFWIRPWYCYGFYLHFFFLS